VVVVVLLLLLLLPLVVVLLAFWCCRQGSTQSPIFWTRTLESIGLLGPTESSSSVDSDSWVKPRSDSPVDSDYWVQTRSGSSVDSDSRVQSKSGSSVVRGLGLSGPNPIGLWFGLGFLVWSGLGSGGRSPPAHPPCYAPSRRGRMPLR
jgi:hypothetical protein